MALAQQEKIRENEGENTMKKKWIFPLLVVAVVLVGCSGKTKKEQSIKNEGVTLMESKDYAGAIKKFDAALKVKDLNKLNVPEIDILRYRAQAEYLAGDYAAADHTYTLLGEVDGDKTEYKNMRVICLSKEGNELDKAKALFDETNALKDSGIGHKEALLELGRAWAKKSSESGDQSYLEQAKAYFAAAAGKEGQVDTQLCDYIGKFYYEIEDYQTALAWFEKGLGLEASNRELLFNQAACYEHMHDYQKALDLFKTYQSNFQDDAKAAHEIAFLESRL
mgnify:FL=1